MSDSKTHKGSCFCGAVELEVTGEPAAAGYCHCASCRHWSAGPINAFTLWPTSAVAVTKGADQIGAYAKAELSLRKFCKTCGGHLFTEHAPWNLIDVYAAILPDLPFKPGVHVNYAQRVMSVKDGLPKLADFPKEMGGTGTAVDE